MSRIAFLPLAALALIAAASPHALAGDERMAGRIPVSSPPEQEAEEQGGDEGAALAEGDVAEDIEQADIMRQLREIIEHRDR